MNYDGMKTFATSNIIYKAGAFLDADYTVRNLWRGCA